MNVFTSFYVQKKSSKYSLNAKIRVFLNTYIYPNLIKVNGKAIAFCGCVLLMQNLRIYKYIYMLKKSRKMSHLHIYAQYYDVPR